MELLLLGGFRFLGRAIVTEAQARGHRLTAFNRGNLPPMPGVDVIHGERDDPSPLAGRRWDVVIDTSGYVPRHVRSAAELLRERVDRYIFVSSISVYQLPLPAGSNEDAPRAVHPADSDPDVYADERYGALKALCEDAAEAAMPGRTVAVRAGFIVGPHDNTDRFASWVERAARGTTMIVPGEADAPFQLIDVRDIAAWIVGAAEERRSGAYNVTGPLKPATVLDVARACVAGTGSNAPLRVVPSAALHAAGVNGWRELPFWFEPEIYGLVQVRVARAAATGLRTRPLVETVRDTLAWLRTSDHERLVTLPDERERALLATPEPPAAARLRGLDHADVRVVSLSAVEAFYDALLPALGLPRKTESHVGRDGEWYEVGDDRPRNAIEYNTPLVPGEAGWFVGFIEDPSMQATGTRIAFALEHDAQLPLVEALVRAAGGRIVEYASESDYPALFFEDPAGTRLEVCARRARA